MLRTQAPVTPAFRPLRLYFVLAFAITWIAGGLALVLNAYGIGPPLSSTHPLYFVAGWGPSVAGIAVTAAMAGTPGVRELFSRMIPRRSDAGWYALVLAGFPVVTMTVAAVGFHQPFPSWAAIGAAFATLPATLFLDTGPLGEEIGWRGFALPQMLRRGTPMVTAVELGIIWGAWHLPTFYISTLTQSRLSLPLFIVNTTAVSVIMTWLYLRTRGDLLLMVLIHLMANFCAGALNVSFKAETVAEAFVAAAILVMGGVERRMRTGSPIEHRERQ
ncbi:MAG TPA: type II CAAX endopeptidase family protein [Gemmatimonadaceae bacterium]|nr:type II CAAX endopeptidase family protein [Gemmatimonadaceae bacterium]